MTRKKLLVLDVNGLLVDTYFLSKKRPNNRHDAKIGRFYVYKRPFCGEFLQFCFENFIVGVWSSAREHNVNNLVDYVFGEAKRNLAFCWHQFDCTDLGLKSPDNESKPLFLKELSKLWSNVKANLPWNEGDYGPANTLLIDDTPYKAILNPPYTGIFPQTYTARDSEDDFLGDTLRKYLEGIRDAENVQSHVKCNPIGEPSITSGNPLWKIVNNITSKVTDVARKDRIICKNEGVEMKDGKEETNDNIINERRKNKKRQTVHSTPPQRTDEIYLTTKLDEMGDASVGEASKLKSRITENQEGALCPDQEEGHYDKKQKELIDKRYKMHSHEGTTKGEIDIAPELDRHNDGLQPGAKHKQKFLREIDVKDVARTDGVMPKEDRKRKDGVMGKFEDAGREDRKWETKYQDIKHKKKRSYHNPNPSDHMDENQDSALCLDQEEDHYDKRQNKSNNKRHKIHNHEASTKGVTDSASDLDQQNYELQPECKQKRNFCREVEYDEIGVHEHSNDKMVNNQSHGIQNECNRMGFNVNHSERRHQRYSHSRHDHQDRPPNYNSKFSDRIPDRSQGRYTRHDFGQHVQMAYYDGNHPGQEQNFKRRWQWHRQKGNEMPYDHSWGSLLDNNNSEQHGQMGYHNENIKSWQGDFSSSYQMQYGHSWGPSHGTSGNRRFEDMPYDHLRGSLLDGKHNYEYHGYYGNNLKSWHGDTLRGYEMQHNHSWEPSLGRSRNRWFEDRYAVKSQYKWERKQY